MGISDRYTEFFADPDPLDSDHVIFGTVRRFWKSISVCRRRKKIKKCSELKRAEEAVTLAIKTLLASGALIAAVPLITYFRNITDVAKIGPSIIVTILPMVYTIGFSIILLPLRSKIRVKIIEFMVETEEEPLEEHENED